jgi:tetratricopeptide (TPR) repeat protein
MRIFTLSILRHPCIKALAQLSLCMLTCTGGALWAALQAETSCDFATQITVIQDLIRNRNYEGGVAKLDKIRHCENLSPLQTFQIGWLYGRARYFSEALAIFKSVPEDVPDRQSHRYAVALSTFETADYKNTVEELKPLALEGSLNEASANLLAVSYSKLRLYQQAQSTLLQEIQKHREDLPAYLNLVTVYADQDMFAEAAKVASQAVQLFPKSPEVVIVRGAANTLVGQLDKAHQDFQSAATLDPTKADARFFLALTDYKQGKFISAVQTLRNAIGSGIVDSDLHYLLAECLLKLDSTNKSEIMGELDRAIELNPNSVSARSLRGKLLLDAGHIKEGAEDLEQAHRYDPTSRSAAYNLARAYRALGKTEEANLLFAQFRTQGSDGITELGKRRLTSALSER